ncbi:winged helix-turn-helix transcriptional regulator [Paractinoplanes atraurantiacus]|uniref:DNA-binding transcriptional regulator, HxlR family n=1 Tax=Paractinoplanes atraurantiacus TaxID=1036182 RepID=A0A285K6S9_9ACTN|nr:helix-turn-helix domain-containing protein [Actinoplanes atraurantiacus]SNY67206.1 DNA-binding transcriptional regulator, HxlR family [Actinoplanes atraurantiacus]
MATRRTYGSYNDGCASAHALDLIGERWALIVVRELVLGPKRFADLQRDIPGVGPSALSRRLQDLEESGIVVRRALPRPANAAVYDLTDWGRELEDVNAALSRWAVRSPRLPLEADMSPDTLVLAMRAHARPVAGASRRVALRLTDSRAPGSDPVEYLATVGPDGTGVVRAPDPGDADARVETTTSAWKALIIGDGRIEDQPAVAVSGDAAAVRALLGATRLSAG